MPAETRRTPVEYWKEMPAFYRELIERYGWKQDAILELVDKLSQSQWAETIYPSTSQEALGLCLCEHYEDRRHAPMVYVQYDGHRGEFEVIFQRGQGHTVSSETCSCVDEQVLQRVLNWINGVTAV